ncbi:hypothetical protein M2146_001177 [Lachnospiraceae bacterium PF1-22]
MINCKEEQMGSAELAIFLLEEKLKTLDADSSLAYKLKDTIQNIETAKGPYGDFSFSQALAAAEVKLKFESLKREPIGEEYLAAVKAVQDHFEQQDEAVSDVLFFNGIQ